MPTATSSGAQPHKRLRQTDANTGDTCSHLHVDADSDTDEPHPGLVMSSDDESDADEPADRVMLIQTTTATDSKISNRNARRMRAGPKVILDICCGHCLMAMYYAQTYAIAVDNGLEQEDALQYVPAQKERTAGTPIQSKRRFHEGDL